MQTHDFEVCGQKWHFCLNGAALFDCYEKFGPDEPLLSHLEGATKKSFDALCWMLAKFAEQGELVHRYQGHKPEQIPSEAFFRANLAAMDVAPAKLVAQAVIRLGFRRDEESPEDEDLDLGLQELEKKTANA